MFKPAMSRALIALLFILAAAAMAQTDDPAILPQDNSGPTGGNPPAPPQEDKTIFGVLPNYRTTEASVPFTTITAKEKMHIAFMDSFTWPSFASSAGFAALYQLENQNPSFGHGIGGYGKRAATAYGDQMIGNMFQEGIIPALGHQDPRYFRLGEGTTVHRLFYALEQIVVARMDSGRRTFNFSEWGGAAVAAAISNAYYPDTRDVSDNVQRVLISCATDAFTNVGKEFWPDIKRFFLRKHGAAQELDSSAGQPGK
jgi:hypothetical protein